jgi:hypothetical protein
VVLVYATSNGGPWVPKNEYTLHIIARKFLTSDGIENDRLDTKERNGGRTGLGLDGTREGSDDD